MPMHQDTTRPVMSHDELDNVLRDSRVDSRSRLPAPVQKALALAAVLQDRATELQTPQERRQQSELDHMIHSKRDKVTLTQLTDQAFRSETPHRAADQLVHILDVQGIPRFFSPVDRALLKGFQSFGSYLPGVAVPLVKEKMHHETANVVLPAEEELLAEHLRRRRDEGVRMNVNYLGEALLGEAEAEGRLQAYLHALQMPEIEVISIKISTLFSQISPMAREHTIGVLCDRLELLFRAACKESYTKADGGSVGKFVYMDMEEYRDMSLTAEAFMRTLERPGLEHVRAGIALQAYIPDSYRTQVQLNQWARNRIAKGGSPITLRIVKGANMEMERFEATLHGWPQAPFKQKVDTDANYKRMLHEGLNAENIAAVRLGIASHNLFEMAYAMVCAHEQGVWDHVQFEMLEGMANHQRRALWEMTNNVLLYAPACKKDEFVNAIGYLIRRLDENTGPDNFLRHAFKLSTDGKDWNRLREAFLNSMSKVDSVSSAPRRFQDRNHEEKRIDRDDSSSLIGFSNEPDTDFSLIQNSKWAERIVEKWRTVRDGSAISIPLVIDGQRISQERPIRQCLDPSRPGVVVGTYPQASADDIDRAVASAMTDADGWRRMSCRDRASILHAVSGELRVARFDLIGAAIADGGKTIAESDPEVSEAIDFVELYARTACQFSELSGLDGRGRGVVVVVSPWNFPLAIPCGGIAAALAAGNTVILKPASHTVLPAYRLCQCFWKAGVPRRSLQLVPCAGSREGQQLVCHQNVDTVILTGGTSTALAMLKAKPTMRLLAETGGKNATIVTSLSDRDVAIKHVVHSAFSHGGQKCSATSLLILEDEVYHDEEFRDKLCDAVESLDVGSAWDLTTRMGPLISPPQGDLERGLKDLEPGETWAVMPRRDEDNPNLYTPGVKWDVRPGSFTHMTELFGPVLGVMKARNLYEAINRVNQTGYGLTSGLQSLDDREQEIWQSRVRAGNLYINRPTTGAIVLRQPFGGMGKSAFGPGIKAGGPNYAAQLMRFRQTDGANEDAAPQDPSLKNLIDQLRTSDTSDLGISESDIDRVATAYVSYERWARDEFLTEHDHFRLIGQDNIRRYLPIGEMRIRVEQADTPFDVLARVGAARVMGCRMTVSVPIGLESRMVRWLDRSTHSWAASIEFVEESEDQLADLISERQTDRIRYASPGRVGAPVRKAAANTGFFLADEAVTGHGRLELLWYCQEQSKSYDYHRYGNLGARSDEERCEPL